MLAQVCEFLPPMWDAWTEIQVPHPDRGIVNILGVYERSFFHCLGLSAFQIKQRVKKN